MRTWFAVFGLVASATGCLAGPRLVYPLRVPAQFSSTSTVSSSNGMSPRSSYTEAYESFWWNCVMVKADDLKARCPAICSGAPAASSGCLDGGTNASRQIDRLLERCSDREIQSYLRSLVSNPDVIKRFLESRFGGHPEAGAEPKEP
jgi:hypothetical protein